MDCKKACLVVDLKEGRNMAQITDMIAVLSAAGWKTDIALKVYGGESMKLATKAAKKGYDLVIAYGGDGTLNQVVNGVMHAGGKSIVGVIPGGTANEWAGEIAVPGDHVKAALTLVNSDARYVDLGHVEVEELIFPHGMRTDQSPTGDKKSQKKKKDSAKTKQHFLLMAGLGIDAAVIANTSKPLKDHMGRMAFDLAAAKELPKQHPFAVSVHASGNGSGPDMHWQGEALQVIVANTRRYANMVEITPDAYVDDGLLDVCVITGGNPLATVEQVASLLLRRKPDDSTSKFLHGAHLSICVPASIKLQLDGDAVDLKDYLSKAEGEALQQVEDAHLVCGQGEQKVMVNYSFDAEPHALQMAIPRTYDNALFQHAHQGGKVSQERDLSLPQNGERPETVQGKAVGDVEALMEHGDRVTVVGAVAHPDKSQVYIIAGNMQKQNTEGQTQDPPLPVAVRVDGRAIILKSTGEYMPATTIEKLQEGEVIVVEGKKNKRGVIRATHVVI